MFVLVSYDGGLYLAQGDTRTAMLGGITNMAMLALGYFFGSSKGSQDKDSTNREMAQALATSAPVQPDSTDNDADTAEALNAAELLRNKLGAAQP